MEVLILGLSGAAYMVLVDYAFVNAQPLRGSLRRFFIIAVAPICVIFLVINIMLSSRLFPGAIDILFDPSQHHLSNRASGYLAIVLATPLPAVAVWFWYRFLLAIQDKSGHQELCPVLKGRNELSPERIELQKGIAAFGEAIIFRPKELFPASEYFFIVLNGSIVAALKPAEYTRIVLDRPINEIGQYAIQTRGIVKRKYRYNYAIFPARADKAIMLSVVYDLLSGSPMKEIGLKKAKEYEAKFAYAVPGPRLAET